MTANHRALPAEMLEVIRQFDTCIIANAIEGFGVRLRNEGYTMPGLQCVSGWRVLSTTATTELEPLCAGPVMPQLNAVKPPSCSQAFCPLTQNRE